MATYRLQCAIWWDSLAAKDAVVIDPVFNIAQPLGGEDDPQQLCSDLCQQLQLQMTASPQVRVRAYELPYVRGAGHVGESVRNNGSSPPSNWPRQLALCLSFYSEKNSPRTRGRLFIPFGLINVAPSGNRPTTAMQTAVMNLVPIFTGLGGVNVDWSVWSVRDHTNRAITNTWVDDRYDVIRSRALQPSSRMQGTTTEDNPPNLVRLQAAGADVPDAPVPAAA